MILIWNGVVCVLHTWTSFCEDAWRTSWINALDMDHADMNDVLNVMSVPRQNEVLWSAQIVSKTRGWEISLSQTKDDEFHPHAPNHGANQDWGPGHTPNRFVLTRRALEHRGSGAFVLQTTMRAPNRSLEDDDAAESHGSRERFGAERRRLPWRCIWHALACWGYIVSNEALKDEHSDFDLTANPNVAQASEPHTQQISCTKASARYVLCWFVELSLVSVRLLAQKPVTLCDWALFLHFFVNWIVSFSSPRVQFMIFSLLTENNMRSKVSGWSLLRTICLQEHRYHKMTLELC